ncbi:uncharacterized protein [Apostichopus japonicus]|uniref:uncharacterized protein isoform X2 n=1 Tax=Stichopus japonicus TaxID=307972 RepID=UPI003AB641AD
MTTPQKVLEEVGADNPTNCVISNSNNECCPTQQNFPKLPELPSFDERPTTEGTTFESSTSDPYSTADVTRNFTTRVTTHDHDGSTLSTGPTSPTSPISDPPDVPIRTTDIADQLTSTSYYPDNSTTNRGGDHTLIIVLSCVGFICLAVVVCVISYYVYLYWKRKKQRRPNPELPMNNTADLTVTPVNGHSPSPAAERRSGTFHNPDGNFVELHPATKPAWEGNDNDGYQSDSEVNGNGGNVDSGVVISPKPEMNGTEETKEDNKPKKKKKKKKKKKAPDLNESLIERPPAEKKTKPTEVIT